MVKAVGPSDDLWLMKQQRPLIGLEFAALQGVCLERDMSIKNAHTPDNRIRALMGDAMNLYQVMVHLTAVLSLVPLPEVPAVIPPCESDDDVVHLGGAVAV